MQAASRDRQVQRAIKDACAEDILFWINCFTYLAEPRGASSRVLPFVTWPFQEDTLRTIVACIRNGEDLVMDKSRDMGASWMCLAALTWLWQFKSNMSFLVLSRNEKLVDKPGDPDALFWKVDHLLKWQPEWMLPNFKRTAMHFANESNGSTIDGDATTKAASVGGRRTAIFLDEFSRMANAEEILSGTADVTNCRIFNFTPWGASGAAYKLSQRKDVKRITLNYWLHPEKGSGLYRWNEDEKRLVLLDKTYQHPEDYQFVLDGKTRSPWYDKEEKRRQNPREMAQHVDIDYAGSAFQFFTRDAIDKYSRRHARPPLMRGEVTAAAEHPAFPLGFVRDDAHGRLRLWLPLDGAGGLPADDYVAGADISAGTGASNSCIKVASKTTGLVVAELTTPYIPPKEFAALCVRVLRWIGTGPMKRPPLLCWETNGPGSLFGRCVAELQYAQVHYEPKPTVGGGYANTPGWSSSKEGKLQLLEDYREGLMLELFVNPSMESLNECLEFVHMPSGAVEHISERTGDGDPSGARSNHGDRVIASALAYKLARASLMEVRKSAIVSETDASRRDPPIGSLAWRRQQHEASGKNRDWFHGSRSRR